MCLNFPLPRLHMICLVAELYIKQPRWTSSSVRNLRRCWMNLNTPSHAPPTSAWSSLAALLKLTTFLSSRCCKDHTSVHRVYRWRCRFSMSFVSAPIGISECLPKPFLSWYTPVVDKAGRSPSLAPRRSRNTPILFNSLSSTLSARRSTSAGGYPGIELKGSLLHNSSGISVSSMSSWKFSSKAQGIEVLFSDCFVQAVHLNVLTLYFF